jgi:hypothetical protein
VLIPDTYDYGELDLLPTYWLNEMRRRAHPDRVFIHREERALYSLEHIRGADKLESASDSSTLTAPPFINEMGFAVTRDRAAWSIDIAREGYIELINITLEAQFSERVRGAATLRSGAPGAEPPSNMNERFLSYAGTSAFLSSLRALPAAPVDIGDGGFDTAALRSVLRLLALPGGFSAAALSAFVQRFRALSASALRRHDTVGLKVAGILLETRIIRQFGQDAEAVFYQDNTRI